MKTTAVLNSIMKADNCSEHWRHGETVLPAFPRPEVSKFQPSNGSHFWTALAGNTRTGWSPSPSHKEMKNRLKCGSGPFSASVPIT